VPISRPAAENVGMLWVLGAVTVWFALALVVAVVIGRGIRLADRREARSAVLTTADLPTSFVAAS
jgi:hypothetical protein